MTETFPTVKMIEKIIQDETPRTNHWIGDSHRAAKRIFEMIQTGEFPPHSTYPHEPGYLVDCPNCEDHCHCTYGNSECVYEGDHISPVAPCAHCAETLDCIQEMWHCSKCGQCDAFTGSKWGCRCDD